MPKQQLTVMISSTARDLPEHRKQVMEACLRQGMFPIMMEHLPASDAEAIAASLRMVDDADIYVLILAHRYGYVPKTDNPQQISITEMEYNRAVERKIRRAVFIVDKTQPLSDFTIDDIDIGENATKLKNFKERCEGENIVNFFRSPEDLRAHVINSLSKHRESDLTTFHYVSDIPTPPEAFIAHPYTLLQTHTLIGRQAELKLLTDWFTGKTLPGDIAGDSVRIMSVVAIGGMGKSALTWKWFNDIAAEEMKTLAGRMWWTFYESDATFENFVTRALAYATKRPLDQVQQIPAPERESQLLAALNREPYLLVLDGLERILIAYSRMDASRLGDSQIGKEGYLRKTADPRIGSFLKKLAQVKNSRILISSRLYPAELETDGGDPIPGSFKRDITGLTDEDAVELWRAFEVTGSRDELLPVFATFGKHPLLIQALAGEVKRYRRAPGDFEKWRKGNARFDPGRFPDLQKAMSHVLEFALRGLNDKALRTMQVIAAFRMPATYDTLTAVLVGKTKTRFVLRTGKVITEEGKLFDQEPDLIAALTELEDRGLVGWDKRANRYDLHPIVRSVGWSSLSDETRRVVYSSLHAHLEPLSKIDNYLKVNSLEDLTPAIEMFNTLIGLERYDDAANLFYKSLSEAMLYRLSAARQEVQLLEMLFPDGMDQLPRLSGPDAQAYALGALALGHNLSGQPGRAVPFYRRQMRIRLGMEDRHNLSVNLGNLSAALLPAGALYESEASGRQMLIIAQEQNSRFSEGASLHCLGLTLAARGVANDSNLSLQRALRIQVDQDNKQGEGYVSFHLAQRALWFNEFAISQSFADRAWELAHVRNLEADFILSALRQGAAALGLGDFTIADERLHHALTRARLVNYVEVEIPALVALAESQRRQGDLKAAREFLDDVWESAERGPYPLIHADACNVLAQIERDAGNTTAAIEAATKAYRLAWCDGPPFAYHWGLEAAKKHLKELGAPEPELPPFDASKFEPMPEVEIDPADEFHAGSASDDA